jgi:hypothetical protein
MVWGLALVFDAVLAQAPTVTVMSIGNGDTIHVRQGPHTTHCSDVWVTYNMLVRPAIETVLKCSSILINKMLYLTFSGGNSLSANAIYLSDTAFIICKGSNVSPCEAVGCPDSILQARQILIDKGVIKKADCGLYVFSEDHPFNSPYIASSVVSGCHSDWHNSWNDLEGRSIKLLIESEDDKNFSSVSAKIITDIDYILAQSDDDEALDGFEDRSCHNEIQDFLKTDFSGAAGLANINSRNMVQASIRLLCALDLTVEASLALDMCKDGANLDHSEFEIEEMCNELLYFYRNILNPLEFDVDHLVDGYDDPGCSLSDYVTHAVAVGVKRGVVEDFVTMMAS